MEVRSGHAPGRADEPDDFPRVDDAPGSHPRLAEVAVEAEEPEPMVEDDRTAGEEEVLVQYDPSTLHGVNDGPGRRAQVHAAVRRTRLAVEYPTAPEARRWSDAFERDSERTEPEPLPGHGPEQRGQTRRLPRRARPVPGTQVDEALRHLEVLFGKGHGLDGQRDRAGSVVSRPQRDARVAGSLLEIDADEGAPGSLRIVAPEAKRFRSPRRDRLDGSCRHLEESNASLCGGRRAEV